MGQIIKTYRVSIIFYYIDRTKFEKHYSRKSLEVAGFELETSEARARSGIHEHHSMAHEDFITNTIKTILNTYSLRLNYNIVAWNTATTVAGNEMK